MSSTWTGAIDTTWENSGNGTNWPPGTTDAVTIPDFAGLTNIPAGPFSAAAIAGLTIVDGQGLAVDYAYLTVNGTATINDTFDVNLAALRDDLLGINGGGSYIITDKTGDGTLNIEGNEVHIVNLHGYTLTIGPQSMTDDCLRVENSTTAAQILFNSASLFGDPRMLAMSTFHGKIVSDKTGGIACNVRLLGSQLAADVVLESRLNGVVVTDGGTFSNFNVTTFPNAIAAVTGSTGGSHAVGSLLSGTFSGVKPQDVQLADVGLDSLSINNDGTWSGRVPAALEPGSGYSLKVLYGADSSGVVLVDTITVTAAVSNGLLLKRRRALMA